MRTESVIAMDANVPSSGNRNNLRCVDLVRGACFER